MEEEKGLVPRVKHPLRSAAMGIWVGQRGILSRKREHEGKFESRNTQVILKNGIIATLCKVLPIYYPPIPSGK